MNTWDKCAHIVAVGVSVTFAFVAAMSAFYMSYIFNNRQNANLQMSKMESDGRNGKQKAAKQSRRMGSRGRSHNPSFPESSAFICGCIDISTYICPTRHRTWPAYEVNRREIDLNVCHGYKNKCE